MPMSAASCSVSEGARILISVACRLQYKQYITVRSVACRSVQYVNLCMYVFIIFLSVVDALRWDVHSPVWNCSWMELELLLSSLIWCSFLHLNECLKLLLKAKLRLSLSGGPLPLAECANLGGSGMLEPCDTRSNRLGKSESQVMIFHLCVVCTAVFSSQFLWLGFPKYSNGVGLWVPWSGSVCLVLRKLYSQTSYELCEMEWCGQCSPLKYDLESSCFLLVFNEKCTANFCRRFWKLLCLPTCL